MWFTSPKVFDWISRGLQDGCVEARISKWNESKMFGRKEYVPKMVILKEYQIGLQKCVWVYEYL